MCGGSEKSGKREAVKGTGLEGGFRVDALPI